MITELVLRVVTETDKKQVYIPATRLSFNTDNAAEYSPRADPVHLIPHSTGNTTVRPISIVNCCLELRVPFQREVGSIATTRLRDEPWFKNLHILPWQLVADVPL